VVHAAFRARVGRVGHTRAGAGVVGASGGAGVRRLGHARTAVLVEDAAFRAQVVGIRVLPGPVAVAVPVPVPGVVVVAGPGPATGCVEVACLHRVTDVEGQEPGPAGRLGLLDEQHVAARRQDRADAEVAAPELEVVVVVDD